jgi:hypothetical protein
VQLAASTLGRLARGLARLAVLGVLLADHLVGPAKEQLPVVARNAENPGDDRQWERRGDALDEVELARDSRGRRLAEDPDRDPVDIGAGVTNGTRREALVRHPAHETVLRGIEHHDHLRRREHDSGGAERDPLRAREALGVPRDLQDVGMLRDRPEWLEALGCEVRHRCFRPQARPDVVRVAAAGVALGVDKVERVDVGGHRHDVTSRPKVLGAGRAGARR